MSKKENSNREIMTKRAKKFNTKKKIIFGFILMLIVAATFTGYKILSNHNVEFIDIDEEDEKYQSKEIEKPDGAVVTDYFNNPNDVLFIANWIVSNSSYYDSDFEGVALAKVAGINYRQITKVYKAINDNEAFHETLSISSLVKVALQRYITSNSYLQRNGKNVSENGATYDNNISSISRDKYLELYGNLPFGMSQYILRDEYIISSKYIGEKDGLYSFYYEFAPYDATLKYARQVKTMAGANGLPEFSRANFVLTVDKDFYVQSIEFDEYYDLPLMGGLKITLTATENFHFYDAPIEVKERSEFEPFFNAVADDSKADAKSGMTYLTEAFSPLMDGGAINISGNIAFDEFNYPINASVDIGNMNICAQVGEDIALSYCDNDIALMLGNNKIKIKADKLLELLSKYLNLDLANMSLDSLLESPALSGALDNMQENITTDKCVLTINLAEGITADIILDIDESNNASLDKIAAAINIDGEDLLINIAFVNEKANYPSFEDANEFKDIDVIIENLIEMIENHQYGCDIVLSIPLLDNELKINGSILADVNYDDLLSSKVSAILNIEYLDVNIPLQLTYEDEIIYINYQDNFTLLLSIDDILELLKDISLPELPEIEIVEIIKEILSKIDFNSLLKELKCDNGLSVILNINDFVDFDHDISLEIADGIKLGVADYGTLELYTKQYVKNDVPTKNVIDFNGIKQYIELVNKFIDNPSFGLNLNVDYEDVKINGSLYIDINNLNIDGMFDLNYLDISTTLIIKKVDDVIQLSIDDKIIELSIDDIMALIDELNEEYHLFDELNLESLDLNLDLNVESIVKFIPTILNGLSISNESINLNINVDDFIDLGIGAIDVKFDVNNESLLINNELFNVEISQNEHEFELLSGDKLSYQSIENILNTIVKVINQQYLEVLVNANYNGISVIGNLIVDYKNIDFVADLQIKYESIDEVVQIRFIEDVLQIKLRDNVFSLSIDEIKALLSDINSDFELFDNEILDLIIDVLDGKLPQIDIDLTNVLSYIPYLLDAISFNEEEISLSIDTSLFDLSLGTINVDYSIGEETLLLDSDYLDLKLNLLDNYEFVLFDDISLGYNEINTLYKTVVDALVNLVLEVEFDASIEDIDVSGNLIFDVYEMNLMLNAELRYQDLAFEVNIVKLNDVIQIKFVNILIELSIEDVETFLLELQSRYNILDNQTIELIVNLLDGKLPDVEIDLSSILGFIPTILDNLNCDNAVVSLNINPTMFDIDFDVININYDINNELLYVDNNLFNAAINLIDLYEISLFSGESVTIDTFIKVLDTVDNFIANPLFKADLSFNYDINGLALEASGEIIVDFNNLSIQGALDVVVGPIKALLQIALINDHIQIKLGNIIIDLTIDDILMLLNNINNRYNVIPSDIIELITDLFNGNLPLDYQSLLGFIPSILENLFINDECLTLSIDPMMFDIDFEEILLQYDFNEEELSVTNSILNLEMYQIDAYSFELCTENLITYDNIDQVLDKVDALIDLFKNKEFSLHVDGDVFDGTKYLYQIDGSLYLKLKETDTISLDMIEALSADLLLIDTKMQHDIDLQIVDDIVYFTYTNYALNDTSRKTPKGTTKAYISVEKLFETLNYANQMFIKNDLINQLVGSYGKELDTSVLDTVIFGDNDVIDITNIINELLISATKLNIGINHDFLNDYYPGGTAEITINNSIVDEKVVIDEIIVDNFYTAQNTIISLDAYFDDNYLVLTSPDLSGYLDLNSIPELLTTLNNTIEIKNYDLTGSIELSIGDIFSLADIEIELKIALDGSNVKVYGKLEIPYKTLVLENITNAKTRTEIYFNSSESNNIYLKRSVYKKVGIGNLAYYTSTIASSEYRHEDANTFLANLIDNICYMFNLADWIKDLIVDGASDSSSDSSSTNTIYYADLVKNYQYKSSSYVLTANGKSLTKGIVGDISATINYLSYNNELFFNKVVAQTSVLSILEAKVEGSLKNFNNGYSIETFINEMNNYQLADFNH